jgi:prephenate dehydratase
MTNLIAFQGELGANSHMACFDARPDMTPMPCDTFEECFAAVTEGRAALAMIPIENSIAGRVADIHHLLPRSGLHIVGEFFMPIHFDLMGVKGAKLEDIKFVRSHIHALGQCRNFVRQHKLKTIVAGDTAGAAREIAELNDKAHGAFAPPKAAEIYGLDVLATNVEDEHSNTTRFILLSKTPHDPEPEDGPCITSFIFRVRNVPAALYKAMGGFATNGVNMHKLESYQLEGSFTATQFYAEIDGHPQDPAVGRALEELSFFSSEFRILGVYLKAPFRQA